MATVSSEEAKLLLQEVLKLRNQLDAQNDFFKRLLELINGVADRCKELSEVMKEYAKVQELMITLIAHLRKRIDALEAEQNRQKGTVH